MQRSTERGRRAAAPTANVRSPRHAYPGHRWASVPPAASSTVPSWAPKGALGLTATGLLAGAVVSQVLAGGSSLDREAFAAEPNWTSASADTVLNFGRHDVGSSISAERQSQDDTERLPDGAADSSADNAAGTGARFAGGSDDTDGSEDASGSESITRSGDEASNRSPSNAEAPSQGGSAAGGSGPTTEPVESGATKDRTEVPLPERAPEEPEEEPLLEVELSTGLPSVTPPEHPLPAEEPAPEKTEEPEETPKAPTQPTPSIAPSQESIPTPERSGDGSLLEGLTGEVDRLTDRLLGRD